MPSFGAPVLALLLAICCFSSCTYAWGPLSHQLFACHFVSNEDCVNASGSFVLGAFSPDAFKKSVPQLHSFDFAEYMLTYAHSMGPDPVDAFQPTNFSLGFVAHLLQDYVGHHHNGFLNPAEDHPLEVAVDALEWNNRPEGFRIHSAGADAVTFFSKATQGYADAQNNSVYALTTDKVSLDWTLFDGVMIAELGLISFYSSYEADIVKYDVCNATDFEPQAHANLNLAQQWTNQAIQVFLDSWQQSFDAHSAILRATAWVDGAFVDNNGNNCAHAH